MARYESVKETKESRVDEENIAVGEYKIQTHLINNLNNIINLFFHKPDWCGKYHISPGKYH